MPNYKQSSVTAGEAWTRAYQVVIENRLDQVPVIVFNEEIVVNTGTTKVSKHISSVGESFQDPTKTFELIHPETGANLGTASYQQLYVFLSSLYLHVAQNRDIAANVPTVMPTNPAPAPTDVPPTDVPPTAPV